MSALTVKELVNAHHTRLTAPDRPCDKCLELPPAGETLKIATIRFPTATVAFSICDRCEAAELERFKDHVMPHGAADIFTCHQEPDGLNRLSDELVAQDEWITRYSAPGQRCDECQRPLAADEPPSTAAVAMTGAISDRSILHAVCLECAKSTTPNIRAKCERFLARIVSTRATAFIPDLINPKKVVN
jgi:hypothetical protein